MKRLAVLDDYEKVARSMADWTPLERDVAIEIFHDHVPDESALAQRLRDFEIVCLMRERTPFPRSLIERLPNLQHLYTSGMRNWSLDLEAAHERNIVVTGTPTLNYPAVEHTWALILALFKRIVEEDRATRAGKFGTGVNLGLKGRVLGVIGLGKLGAQVAMIGKSFDMNVVAWSRNLTPAHCDAVGVRYVSKDEMFRNSDVITLHVQLGGRNRGLVGATEIAAMKPTAFLVNTARGPVVDEPALIAALQNRRIAGAGLDVFDTEPLNPDHPLLKLPNTVITPHQGYVIEENYVNFFRGAVSNVRSWLDGRIVNALT